MKDISACLFDFNGTMFFDGKLHDRAWRETISERLGRDISDEEIRRYIYGCNNKDIVAHFFAKEIKEDSNCFDVLVREVAFEKESRYRDYCREQCDPDNDPEKTSSEQRNARGNVARSVTISLAPGLSHYLDRLKAEGKQMAIASAATKENFELYFEVFQLERWFTWNEIVYDDGTLPGKPFPDVWLEAAKRLGVNIDECVVFEDSLNGILAAGRAGAAKIVAVYGDADKEMLSAQGIADEFIEDYRLR